MRCDGNILYTLGKWFAFLCIWVFALGRTQSGHEKNGTILKTLALMGLASQFQHTKTSLITERYLIFVYIYSMLSQCALESNQLLRKIIHDV